VGKAKGICRQFLQTFVFPFEQCRILLQCSSNIASAAALLFYATEITETQTNTKNSTSEVIINNSKTETAPILLQLFYFC
jgi:hypothetical protein